MGVERDSWSRPELCKTFNVLWSGWMIVEPGFLDHWKTRRLVELTGDNTAPLIVLRLWAHCHKAKMWRFRNLTNEKLAGICGWKGEEAELQTTLIKCGFLNIQGPFLVVHEWEKYNRKLISCWKNGAKGGRYCKTQPEPNGNPIEPTPTHANPPNHIISNLNLSSLTVPVRTKFEKWVQVRTVHHKVKNWELMFNEQIEMLGTYAEADQLEILSASIRGGWQGLFPPSTRQGNGTPSKPFLSFQDRAKRKGEIQEQLNQQFRAQGGKPFTPKEKEERDRLKKEMQEL